MLFEPRQPPYLSVWASCNTSCNWTVLGSLKLSRCEPTELAHLDYVWGIVLEKQHKLQPKSKTTDELKVVLWKTSWKSCRKNTSTRRWWTSSST